MGNHEQKLSAALPRDRLTGLLEKGAFYEYVISYIESSPDSHFGILYSDIEDFKAVNERFGRPACDGILAELAQKLCGVLPGCAAGTRIHGDVFAFLLENTDKSALEAALSSLLSWQKPWDLQIRYGLTAYDPTISLYTNCDHARMALESIKGVYAQQLAEFDEEFRRMITRRRQLYAEAESALEHKDLKVYYQPKLDVKTGKIGGAEALIRWQHPEQGMIYPTEFIPLFEKSGFIVKLDEYLYRVVCADLARWREQGLPMVPVSVNLSRRDFENDELLERLCSEADAQGLPYSLIHLELTESAHSYAPERVSAITDALKEKGFTMELDDFGSGYSSLTSLGTLQLPYMKIDKSLIDQVTTNIGEKILASTISLAKTLGMKVVAEGVEREEQHRKLEEMGCDYIQGFLYSKPLPVAEYEKFLKT